MFRIGGGELLLILLILLLLFGAKRLPELGKSLAKALREFRKVSRELEKENHQDKESE